MKTITILKITGVLTALVSIQTTTSGQGMPPESRDTIHGLFDSHAKFQREVTETEEGYISKTTSDDPAAVKLLQSHVKQMESRLKEGLMVRAWDPAYVEFVNHYDDIDIQITNIENGISIVTIGKTEAAKLVARNHAGIVSKFIDHGWTEHDKAHAAVFGDKEVTVGMKGKGGMSAMSCCQKGDQETAQSGACRSSEGSAGCMMEARRAENKGQSCCQKAI